MRFVLALLLLAVVAVSCYVAVAEEIQSSPETLLQFSEFQQRFGKTYASKEEEAKRYSAWLGNLNRLPELRAMNPMARFEMNQVSDLSYQEFADLYLSKTSREQVIASFQKVAQEYPDKIMLNANPPPVNLSGRFDYRDINMVTAIKDQGQCGSCWAFAATECIESAWAKAGGGLLTLSPQQILDCSGAGSCGGGYPDQAIAYSTRAWIMQDSAYPYVGYQQGCMAGAGNVLMQYLIPLNNPSYNPGHPLPDDTVGAYIATYGPVAFGIWGDLSVLQTYAGGILTYCPPGNEGHAMNIVGWEDYSNGYPVWAVRNSWNTWWGESGFVYFGRNQNVCGINEYLFNTWP